MAKDRKPPKAPPPPHPDVGKEVLMTCRVKGRSCPGRLMRITMVFSLPEGGNAYRYRCTTCNGVFHISF